MMKGYLTVFLSLSLTALIGFVLFLTGNAIRNGGKVRLECATDIGMNSVLAEFSVALQERYELFYIDASYLGRAPSVSNIEERLDFYIRRNLSTGSRKKPWMNVELGKVTVPEVIVAAEGEGESMKYQAVRYIQDSNIQREEAEIFPYLWIVGNLDEKDAMGEWSALQEQIAGIELPRILNEKGEPVEVPLGNPADRVFGMAGSDILYLLNINMNDVGVGCIRRSDYISERKLENVGKSYEKNSDDKLFLTYLFEKMGNYRKVREASVLLFQLEYVACKEASDYENLKAVVDRLIKWRFALNSAAILESGSMYEEALSLAMSLQAVQLKEEFREPVTMSILYACAYLESLSEVQMLLNGGSVPLEKNGFCTGIAQVISGEFLSGMEAGGGLDYEQYLACMIMLLPEAERNMRTMDIMEMDIRSLTGNPCFSMDFCVEKYSARVEATGMMRDNYTLTRTYGYY